MPRICTICARPDRLKIDEELAIGSASKRAIAERLSISLTSLGRHEANHLPATMVEAARVKVTENGTRLYGRVDRLVGHLETLANRCAEYGNGDDLLKAARELRPSLELLGRVSGEIANDRITAFLIAIGVKSEEEAKRAVQIAGIGRETSIDEAFADWCELGRMLLRERPEWRDSAAKVLREPSSAVLIENGNGGHP